MAYNIISFHSVLIKLNQVMKNTLIAFFLLVSFSILGQDIFKKIENLDHKGLEELLNQGEPTDQYDDKGMTPLWKAVHKNDTISLNLLLEHGADINFLEKRGMHPIMIGCLANSVESVKILLDNGVDVNWRSDASRRQQPIRFASQGGSLDLVRLLLDYGADLESAPNDMGTPLLAALHAKQFEIAEFYFNEGANVSVVGRDGECVIHEAIKTKNPSMVKLAIKYGAPLDLIDSNKKTTWQLAKKSANSEIRSLVKSALREN